MRVYFYMFYSFSTVLVIYLPSSIVLKRNVMDMLQLNDDIPIITYEKISKVAAFRFPSLYPLTIGQGYYSPPTIYPRPHVL